MVGRIEQSWSGRQEDILLLDIGIPQLGKEVPVGLSIGEPRSIAGIQKCVQSFVLLLLTRLGTALNPNLGSDLLSAIQQQRVRTNQDLRNQFSLAVSQVAPQVNQQAFAPDERLASAVLEGATVEQQRITLRIRLTTEAGEAATFLAPIARDA